MSTKGYPHGRTNDNNGNNDGGTSYFQKTVCLRDWWLIKADNEFEGKRLGVAGLTSSELQPVRMFTSAPIVKRFDIFTLETADGICVVVKGFINRSRTNENGFSSEIFSHFLFGFPPNWEEYAEKCLEGHLNTGIDFKGIADFDKSKMDPGVGDPITVLSPIKFKNEIKEDKHDIEVKKSFPENVFVRSTNDALKVSSISENECHPNYTLSPVKNKNDDVKNDAANDDVKNDAANDDVKNDAANDDVKNDADKDGVSNDAENIDVENDASENFVQSLGCDVNDVSSLDGNIAIHEEPSSCCVVESSERMGNPESSGKFEDRTMRKLGTKGSASLGSVTTQNDASRDSPTLQSNKDVNKITLSEVETKIQSVSSPSNFENRKYRHCLRNLNINQGRNSTTRCSVLQKKKEHVSEAYEDPDGGKMKRRSSETTTNRSMGGLLRNFSESSEGKEKDVIVCGLSVLMASNRVSNIEKTNTLEGRGIFNPLNDELQGQLHSTMVNENTKQGGNVTQTGMPSNNSNKLTSSPYECGDMNHTYDFETAAKEGESCAKEGSSSRKKTKRRINFNAYASPTEKITSVVSPESCKRSRSGRLLVPTLQFWRNQVAVYDVDRRIIGIQENLNGVKSSRGTRSEPQERRRQFS